jgi:putative ABC transport system substrate-binding protein
MTLRRREFITTLFGGAAAWPLAAHAQPRENVRRIGVLMNLSADDPEGQARLAALLQGLQEAGWAVGRNVRIDIRWGAGDIDRIRQQAAEIVGLAPDIIFASTNQVMVPLGQATRNLPVVFAAVTDPVAGGFVTSLAHPGGNATGVYLRRLGMSAKWLELLRDIAPGLARAAVLHDAGNPGGIPASNSLLSGYAIPARSSAPSRNSPSLPTGAWS